MWVQSLGQEDSQEKEMATHSSILAWRIPHDKNDFTYLMPFPDSFPSSTQAVAHLLLFPGYFTGMVALLFISTVKCICLHNNFLRIFHAEVG